MFRYWSFAWKVFIRKKKKRKRKKGEKSKADEKRRGEDWERTKERQNQATGENEVRMKIA